MPDTPAPTPAWLNDAWSKTVKKTAYSVRRARELDEIPYTTKDGGWHSLGPSWWTNGFWPALMWQMAIGTGDALYREEAERGERLLDRALERFEDLHHDLGFQFKISSAVNYALTKNPKSLRRATLAANLLAGRFNPNGFIRAWNGERIGWSIIDSMMNLPMLYWASRESSDPRFRLIAERHADHTARHFIRPDASCHHIVIFDPVSDAVLDTPRGQGYAPGTSWTRGQAWALYGFTLSHLWTGKPEYLDVARRVADRFLERITPDWIPNIDFEQPDQPYGKDNAAGAIAACGLLELAALIPDRTDAYRDGALNMLRAMADECADWDEADPGILKQCTGSYTEKDSWHIKMVYGDYFFVEALLKLKGSSVNLWLI
ncbi:MAG: glycoside hydrolase family 88 protein [Oscillospiraceae bacterium]|jgi:unsaturated chondroitin disaccharide hydrolase|nr:glycoside hydrolase family 88 protein [Oscillospiraceae bacterium]